MRSIFNASCIGHGMPSLFSLFSITPRRHHPSAYEQPGLCDILAIVTSHLAASPSDLQATVQRRVLDFLAQQTMLASSASIELRHLCLPRPAAASPSSTTCVPPGIGYSALIKISFQCMTLMCNTLVALSLEHLRLYISTLGQPEFGRQADTNIVLGKSLSARLSSRVGRAHRAH